MKLNETDVTESRKSSDGIHTRKCDVCRKTIKTSYTFKLANDGNACSDKCRKAGDESVQINKEQTVKTKTDKKSKKAETMPLNRITEPDPSEVDRPGPAKSSKKTKAAAPEADKPKKAAKASKEKGPMTPREALATVPYSRRMKGDFGDAADVHPLGMFLKALGGPGGGKAVPLTKLDAMCPPEYKSRNVIRTLSWYANEKSVAPDGNTGWGMRIVIDEEAGTAQLMKPTKK
jgi:hypothetical protein